jgi:hypothetical protein
MREDMCITIGPDESTRAYRLALAIDRPYAAALGALAAYIEISIDRCDIDAELATADAEGRDPMVRQSREECETLWRCFGAAAVSVGVLALIGIVDELPDDYVSIRGVERYFDAARKRAVLRERGRKGGTASAAKRRAGGAA